MQTLKMILKDLEWSRSPAERDLFLGSFRQPSEITTDSLPWLGLERKLAKPICPISVLKIGQNYRIR